MSRGVLYIAWGEKGERALTRSPQSLREVRSERPHENVRLLAWGIHGAMPVGDIFKSAMT
jgi:hypothetical protein